MISLEGKSIKREQFNAHPRYQNEESTEKETTWKIQKSDKSKK